MKVELPEENIILEYYDNRDDDFINDEEFDCAGVHKSSRDIRPA